MGKQYTTTGIELINSTGGTIMDSTGIVSTTNFNFGQGTAPAGTQAITSSYPTYTNITGGSVTLSLTRQANILLNYTVSGWHGDFDGIGWIRVSDGTTTYGPNAFISGDGSDANEIMRTVSASFIQNFAAGTYNLQLQATQNNSPGTLNITTLGLINTAAIINYVILGK